MFSNVRSLHAPKLSADKIQHFSSKHVNGFQTKTVLFYLQVFVGQRLDYFLSDTFVRLESAQ